MDKSAPQVEMIKVMDSFKRSVDFYNSYGIKNKQEHKHDHKRPLTEANKWSFYYYCILEIIKVSHKSLSLGLSARELLRAA